MQFERYISHPAKTPEDTDTLLIGDDGRFDAAGHLQTVADRMRQACHSHILADDTPAETVSYVIGLTHDFAKLNSWTQRYLRNQPFPQSDAYRYHAFPSALVTRYCLTHHPNDIGDYAIELATLVVAGHHDIRSPPEPTILAETYGRNTRAVRETYDRVCEQFRDIDGHVATRADRIIAAATNGYGSWEDFRNWHAQRSEQLDTPPGHIVYFARLGTGPFRDGYYGDLVQLWTALKFADQTAASGLTDDDLDGFLPDVQALDAHVAALEQGDGVVAELNDLREQARTAVTENVSELVASDDVGLITLPTGFGKTYAGLSAGLRAADMSDSRLVYALPYTSILDQTANEVQSIFDVDPYSRAFTIHHHLAETYTGLGDHYTDADIGRSPGALHAESWLSGLTLTTTVQLFESLTAPTARQATRLPALHDAVVVIDEPQAIPEGWWQLVPALIELLVTTYDATVILMTATQPGLVTYGSDSINTRELTDNPDQYAEFLDRNPRVTYRLHDTVQTDLGPNSGTLDYPTAGTHISTTATEGADVLAVCNTRTSARELYRHVVSSTVADAEGVELGRLLHDYVARTGTLPTPGKLRKLAIDAARAADTDTVYAFLSGDVRPNDRALLIDALYADLDDSDTPGPLLDGSLSIILISTSVVEAGVDVSFDTVYRDYAPIPNIVQSGGRCNRSFGGETGEVIIWRLASPTADSGIPSLVIHGGDGGNALPLLKETGRVLRHHAEDGRITESTMVSATVTDFYESLFTGPLDPGDEQLPKALDSVSISTLENEHMIDEIEDYEDVVACLTVDEHDDLLETTPDMGAIRSHPGAQVTTNPDSWTTETTIGNSRYLLVDARDTDYHPVFGVQ